MPTLQALTSVLNRLWKTGNLWARWAIALTAGWPPVLALVGMIGVQPLTAFLGLIPVVALVFVLVAWTDPLVIPILAITQGGRTGLQWISTVLAGELLLGVYFALVPVSAEPSLVPLLLLASAALLFLSLGVKFQGHGFVRAALIVLILAITAAFVAGGSDQLKRLAFEHHSF